MKRIVQTMVLGWLSAQTAFATPVDARDLTVRLFSTKPVHALSAEASRGATMRTCDGCRGALLVGLVQVQEGGSTGELLVGGESASLLHVSGELRMKTTDGRSATAAGRWLIRRDRDGLHVALTLPSERYVMAVLQSEANPDDGPEALKALAVVARSFALTHSERHGAEGFCDSTHCQAAHFGSVPARIRDAVTATAGETLWFGGRQVDGYFTQNCGGVTDDAADVWGGPQKPWLRVHGDPFCQKQPAQWHADLTGEELAHSLGAEGFRLPGAVAGVRVLSRDRGGRAAKLEVSAGGTSRIVAASTLRFAINRELGWNRIRSDWYSVHRNGSDVVFEGRGYGHGVGLCQAGAAEMARQGKPYRDILAFYFSGADVRVNATDQGWRQQEANGWTMRTLRPDADLQREGDEGWVRARQVWGVPITVHPVVMVAPDTEIFRQLTNQPGWALASTTGQSITLEPMAVVRAHGALRLLLLHEFLHTIAEGESAPTTPLWFREGLVEVLAGAKPSKTRGGPEQVERALRGATTLQEAQSAHAAAETLVQKLVAQYGLSSVRGWLRTGVPSGVLMSQ